ncbi:MAG: cadherin domain-containing protein [Proteobacteria bacterium]|nr:cadherin domain-containing protein [Pseudomonadota bacterium]
MAVSSTSFSNTPQAGDDLFLSSGTGLTEDTLAKTVCLNVMANDLGGAAKKLYSLDDGIENEGSTSSADLLVKDPTGAISYSQGGARISITEDGKISYNTAGWTDDFKAKLSSLGEGESTFDTFTYAIQLGNGTLSWATVRVEVAGQNDAPTVSIADLEGAVTENDATPILSDSGTITFDDLDLTDTHSTTVTADGGNTLGGTLTALVTTPATGAGAGEVTWIYKVDNDLAQHLGQDQSVTESFTIRISDQHGGYVDQVVTVTVNGTNDIPTAHADFSIDTENATQVIDVLANDTDVDDGHSFTLVSVSVDSGAGSVDIVDNKLQFDPGSAFDHLAEGDSAEVTVSYTMQDEFGAQSSSTVKITVIGTNDAPVITSDATASVAENAPTDTVVYTAEGHDPDDGDSIAWSLGGDDAGLFDISDAGIVTLKNPADYEADNSYDIEVIATDEHNVATVQAVTINVLNVNEKPVIDSGATASVAENADPSTIVYTASATDPDVGTVINWSLGGTDAALFSIDSNGNVRLNSPADFETKSTYQIAVIASDGFLSDSKAVTISVTDVNEAPANTAPDAAQDSWVLSDTFIAPGIITADWFTHNDTDPDGNPIYVTAVSGLPDGLTAHYDGAGHLDYVSSDIDGAAAGSYTLTYTLSDGTATDTADVSLTIVHTTSSTGENFTLDGNDFSYIDGQSAADTLTGDLSLSGNAGIDRFVGSAGDDTLSGGAGDDILVGGAGSDHLIGGAGADRLTGTNNGDFFVYQSTSDSTLAASDVITDFIHNSDKIDLSVIDAVSGGGNDAFAFGGNNANTVANSVTWSESNGNTIIHIDNTGDTVADMQIVLTGTSLNLAAGDFIL